MVKVCLDLRQHGTDSITNEKLAQFQGASLLVHNDSTFAESDFISISQIGDSVKRTQVGKTGRFGVGFNSVYHLTDLPSFVSGRYCVYFDPHCEFLPNVSSQNPGKKIDFVSNDVLGKNPNQFKPFIGFGCDMKSEFTGTTFRFPLRTEAQSKVSRLSKASYSASKIHELLHQFAKEKTLDLLFLKSVQSVEISEWHTGENVPKVVSESRITNGSDGLTLARGAFARASKSHATLGASATIDPPVSRNFDVRFLSKGLGGGIDGNDGESTRTFVVSQALGTALQPLVVQGRDKFGMRLVPWAAVAAELPAVAAELPSDDDETERSRESLRTSSPLTSYSPSGRAFCFLPLPVQTGLPVHVNAFFELSSNRRDVWHGGDMSGGGAARSEWNESLLQTVVSPAYVKLLVMLVEAVKRETITLRSFYLLFPNGYTVPKPWDLVVVNTCVLLANQPVLHSNVDGGTWVTPSDAVYPDSECLSSSDLRESLVQEGVCVPNGVPDGVLELLMKHATTDGFRPTMTSPNGTRRVVRSAGVNAAKRRPRHRVLTLLRYCLADVIDDDAQSIASLADVPLVPLADGTCGVFSVLKGKQDSSSLLYVPSAEEANALLGDARDACVDVFTDRIGNQSRTSDTDQLSADLTRRFETLADSGYLNLKRIDADALASLISRILPPLWRSSDLEIESGGVTVSQTVPWRPPIFSENEKYEKSSEGHPSVQTMQFLWKRLAELTPNSLDLFIGWPLFPVLRCVGVVDETKQNKVENEREPKIEQYELAPVGAAVVAVDAAGFASCLSFEVVKALSEANVRAMVVGGILSDTSSHTVGENNALDSVTKAALTHPAISQKTFIASGAGVADALSAVAKARRTATDTSTVSSASNLDFSRPSASALRSYLLQRRWFGARARLSADGDASDLKRIETIKSLRVFETFQESTESGDNGNESVEIPLTALDGTTPLFLAPDGCDVELLGPEFLNPTDAEQQFVLQNHLGVEKLSPVVFLKLHVLPRLRDLRPTVRDKAMLDALKSLGSLSVSDASITDLLSITPFVPTSSGKLVAPMSLYDPRVPELVELLSASKMEAFPELSSPFSDELNLNTLTRLGMRSGVTRTAILDAAMHAEQLLEHDFELAKKQGTAVLRYLETPDGTRLFASDKKSASASSFFNLFGGDKTLKKETSAADKPDLDQVSFASQLSNIQWVPVSTEVPAAEPGLPRFEESVFDLKSAGSDDLNSNELPPVASPSMSRPPADQWLCSSSRRILSEDLQSQVIADVFGWRTPVTPETLCKQLAALGEKHKTVTHAAVGSALAAAVPRIYQALTAVMRTSEFDNAIDVVFDRVVKGVKGENKGESTVDGVDKKEDGTVAGEDTDADKERSNSVSSTPKTIPSVWVGVGFASTDHVAFAGALHLSPYLHVVPADLLPFKLLLTKLGVRERFCADDYVSLLRLLRKDAGTSHPLSEQRLDMALWVLGAIADRPEGKWMGGMMDGMAIGMANGIAATENQPPGDLDSLDSNDGTKDLPVPDSSGVLRTSTSLRFNDAPWLPSPDGVNLAHSKIPHATAEIIGVQSLRLALLRESSEDIGVSTEDGGEIVSFGQSEALTTRLRHILEAYSDGPGVISELIQNADDAGASEVKLLLDTRDQETLGTKSLLSPKMKTWQGPALVAWNDAVFSAADFHNIARIGQDSKVDRPVTAGRFGLGFNAVYHFTDLPSFVSGEHLVLFDPHANYLPGASSAKPGLKIKFCENSERKNNSSSLLHQFPDQFAGYKDVFNFSLDSKHDGTLFRFPLRSADAAINSEIKPEEYKVEQVKELFAKFQKRAAHTLLFLKNVKKIGVYETQSDTSSPRLLYEVSVPGFENDVDPRAEVTRWVSNSRKDFLDKLNLASDASLPKECGWMDLDVTVNSELNTQTIERQRWLMSCALAGGNARGMSLSETGRKRGLVPWVGVAARVKRDDADDSAQTEKTLGRAFCFLPLPVHTGLPVHVNGYFELSSNRRDVWHGADATGVGSERGEWNSVLLKDAVAPAYAALIQSAAERLADSEVTDDYYGLFPGSDTQSTTQGANLTSIPEPWSSMLPSLYALLVSLHCVRAIDAKTKNSKWIKPSQGIFPDNSSPELVASFSSGGELAEAFQEVLGQSVVVDVPVGVAVAFEQYAATKDVQFASPKTCRRDLKKLSQEEMRKFETKHVLALLAYTLSDVMLQDSSGLADLHGLPLLPLADGTLGLVQFSSSGKHDNSSATNCSTVYVPKDADEFSLLNRGDAKSLLVDFAVFEKLEHSWTYATLVSIAKSPSGEHGNLKAVDADDLSTLLPFLLPKEFGVSVDGEVVGCGRVVEWEGSSGDDELTAGQNDSISSQVLEQLWRRMTELSAATLAPFEGWPLLPIAGGKKLAPLTPHGPLVRGEGWSESCEVSLSALGVTVLHECQATTIAATHTSIDLYARPASGAGILDSAVANAAMNEEQIVEALGRMYGHLEYPELLSPEQRWRAAASLVPGIFEAAMNKHPGDDTSARFALRTFLCQNKWFLKSAPGGAVSGARLDLLKSLPLFETFGSITQERSEKFIALSAPSDTSDTINSNATFGPFLAPPNTVLDDVLLCGSPFLKVHDSSLADFLETKCAVSRLGVVETLTRFILPQIDCGVLDSSQAPKVLATLLNAITVAKASWTGGGDLAELMKAGKKYKCVPTKSGAVQKPIDLFDPRNLTLTSLLDLDTMFPCAPFNKDARIEALVNQLGVRATLGPAGILAAAKAVEAAAYGDGESDDTIAKAAKRGAALLSHLDALSCGAIPGESLPSAECTVPDPGHDPEGEDESEDEADPSSMDENDAETETKKQLKTKKPAEPPRVSFWRALVSISWVPALTKPFMDGMPWPSGPRGRQLHQVAPPRATSVPQNAWITSSCLRILDVDAVARMRLPGVGNDLEIVPPAYQKLPADVTSEVTSEDTFDATSDATKDASTSDTQGDPTGAQSDPSALSAAVHSNELNPIAGTFKLHPDLLRRLGWDKVAVAVVAAQLLELGKAFPVNFGLDSDSSTQEAGSTTGQSALSEGIIRSLNGALLAAYKTLANASVDELDAAATILRDTPWLWTGSGFIGSIDVAVDVVGDTFEPYLWSAPGEISDKQTLLNAFEVRQNFEAYDYLRAAQKLADVHSDTPLSDPQMQTAVLLSEAACDALSHDARGADDAMNSINPEDQRQAQQALLRRERQNQSVRSGEFMLPDSNGVMTCAKSLTQNDAEWLLGDAPGSNDQIGSSTTNTDTGKQSQLRFTHSSVSSSVALKLGTKSLRELYAVDQRSTQRVHCPSANVMRSFLKSSMDACVGVNGGTSGDDVNRHAQSSIGAVAWDACAIAEVLGATSLTINLDVTTYNTKSLLQPQLGSYQGPSLVMKLTGVGALDPFEIAQLLSSAPPMKLRGKLLRNGEGLASVLRLGDVVLTAGGGRLCVFDPCGLVLGDEEPSISETKSHSHCAAKSFSYSDGALPRRFTDQFVPFVNAGWEPPAHANSGSDGHTTYVRVPLRTKTQAKRMGNYPPISNISVDASNAQHALSLFAAQAHKFLLFTSSLERITSRVKDYAHCETDDEKNIDKLLVDVAIQSFSVDSNSSHDSNGKSIASKLTPRTIDKDTEWRRSTLSSFFGGGGTSTKCAYTLTLCESSRESFLSDSKSVTDIWIVGAAIGVGKARELALDRNRDKHIATADLLPVAHVAHHVFRDGQAVDPANPPLTPSAELLTSMDASINGSNTSINASTPGSGLFIFGAPVAAFTNALGEVIGDPVATALSKTPGVISSHFAVKRGTSIGQTIEFVDPRLFEAEDNESSQGTTTQSATSDPSNSNSDPATSRREWNRSLCACVVSASVVAVSHARRVSIPSTIPASTFYGLWPRSKRINIPPPPELDADGRPVGVGVGGAGVNSLEGSTQSTHQSHPASALYVRPLYKALTEQTPGLFRSLGSGQSVKPADGYFLPPGFAEGRFGDAGNNSGSGSGNSSQAARPLAAKFIAKHFPVIDAPSELRPELAASVGVGVAKELTAEALRKLLKTKPPPSQSLDTSSALKTHVELLECATSDVLEGVSTENGASTAYPSVLGGQSQSQQQQPQPSDSLTGVIDAMTAAGVPVNEWLGAAGLGNANATSVGQTQPPSTPSQSPPIRLTAARDLYGVPFPSVSGNTPFTLGSAVLYHASANMTTLVPRLRGQFVHPEVLNSEPLRLLFCNQNFNAATRTKQFTHGDLLTELARSLPPGLNPNKLHGKAIVDWGGSPSPEWLNSFWQEIKTEPSETIDSFGEWPLVPCEGGKLLRVKHRACLFVAPRDFETSVEKVDTSSDEPEESATSVQTPQMDSSSRTTPDSPITSLLSADWHWLAPALRSSSFPVLDVAGGGDGCVDVITATVPPETLRNIVTPGDAFAWKVSTALNLGLGVVFDLSNISEDAETKIFNLIVSSFQRSSFLTSMEGLETVRGLPMFPLAGNDGSTTQRRIALTNVDAKYATVPPDVPFAETAHASDETLEYNELSLPLYHALGVEVLDDGEILARHVAPKLEHLPPIGRTAALAYILRHWQRLKDNESLTDCLKNTKFVDSVVKGGTDTAHGNQHTLKSPGDLYDPEIELIASAFRDAPEMFPGKQWRTKEWLTMLRKCGLRSTVDASLFLECATRVAARAVKLNVAYPMSNYPPVPPAATSGVEFLLVDSVTNISHDSESDAVSEHSAVIAGGGALANHLTKHMSGLFSVSFCEMLAGIPFIPGAFGVPGAPGPMANQCNVLTSFSHAISPEHWPKAFMARPIIPKDFVPPQFSRNSLRFKSSEPDVKTVLEHLLCLGSGPGEGGGVTVLGRWSNTCDLTPVESVKIAIGSISESIKDGDFSQSEVKKLKTSKFIPVSNGAFCESPARLFIRAKKALQPLRFEVPSGLTSVVDVLRLLGTKDVFTRLDAIEMLRITYQEAGEYSLSPNEIGAAIAALHVAAGAGDLAVSETVSGEHRNNTHTLETSLLFAPDIDGVLRPPHSMLHAHDASDWLLRKVFKSSIRNKSVFISHPGVSDKLCRCISIRSLSDASREVRVPESSDAQQCVGGEEGDDALNTEGVDNAEGADNSDNLTALLSSAWPDASAKMERAASQNFANALFRVTIGRFPRAGCFESKETLHNRLLAIERYITVVPTLKTRLEVSKEIGDENSSSENLLFTGTPTKRNVFFCARTDRVFLSAPDTSPGMDSSFLIAPVLAEALVFGATSEKISDDGFLGSAVGALLSARDVTTMAAVANALVPGTEDLNAEELNDSIIDTNDELSNDPRAARAEPGSRVSRRDVYKLRAQPLRPLAAGETCALRVVQTASEAAAAAAERRAECKLSMRQNDHHYVYARVLSGTRPVSGDALQTVSVETKPGVVEQKLTSEVFTFALVSELEKILEEGGDEHVDSTSSDIVGETSGVDTETGDAVEALHTRSSPSQKASSETSLGPSPEVFAKAVADLLSAAGTPMPREQQAMLVEHQKLKNMLKTQTEKALEADTKRAETLQAASSAAEAFTCPITQSPMVDPVVAADGHTYERTAIERWFGSGRLTSPVTNARVSSTMLIPNHALKSARVAWEELEGAN